MQIYLHICIHIYIYCNTHIYIYLPTYIYTYKYSKETKQAYMHICLIAYRHITYVHFSLSTVHRMYPHPTNSQMIWFFIFSLSVPCIIDLHFPWLHHRRGYTQRDYKCITLPETNSLHLKMDGWNTTVSFWGPAYLQGRTVKLWGV